MNTGIIAFDHNKIPRAQEDVAFLDDTAERTLWFFPDGLPASPGPMWDYKRIESGKLVPLEGEEIGQLIARAVEANATERRPWYEPMEKLPQERLINSAMLREYDTLVVEMPARDSLPAGSQQLLARPSQRAEAP
jgi:hypothetical protein